jgi:transcriptional regulator with XRE-family HTH domain
MNIILRPWQLLFVILASWVNRLQQGIIEYLRTENQVLKEKLRNQRILLNDDQRRRLAVKGRILGPKLLEQVGTRRPVHLCPDYPVQSRQLRLRLTQSFPAERLGVSFPTVNRWENGKSAPSQPTWTKLRELAGDPVTSTALDDDLLCQPTVCGFDEKKSDYLHLQISRKSFVATSHNPPLVRHCS